jgi:DNA-binding LytR/AlgR family response regulator
MNEILNPIVGSYMKLPADMLRALQKSAYEEKEEEFWEFIHLLSRHKLDKIKKRKQMKKKSVPGCISWVDKMIAAYKDIDFLYAKGCGDKELRIRCKNRDEVFREETTGNLKNLTAKLNPFGVHRVEKKFSVNVNHVSRVDNEYVYMDDDQKIPWGKKYKDLNWVHFQHLEIDPEKGDFDKGKFKDCDL